MNFFVEQGSIACGTKDPTIDFQFVVYLAGARPELLSCTFCGLSTKYVPIGSLRVGRVDFGMSVCICFECHCGNIYEQTIKDVDFQLRRATSTTEAIHNFTLTPRERLKNEPTFIEAKSRPEGFITFSELIKKIYEQEAQKTDSL